MFGRRGYEGAINSLVVLVQGITREKASSVSGRQAYDSAINSLVAQGITREEASSMSGPRAYDSAINSLASEVAIIDITINCYSLILLYLITIKLIK